MQYRNEILQLFPFLDRASKASPITDGATIALDMKVKMCCLNGNLPHSEATQLVLPMPAHTSTVNVWRAAVLLVG